MPNTFSAGVSYQFQIAVTESSGLYLRSYFSIVTNMPGNCVNPISFSPTTGVVLKTYIKFSITGCFDLDQQDYPLKYSFGYNNGIRDNPITTLNGNNEINSIFPTGSLYPYTTVCDSLGDCNTIRSVKVLKINSSRRLQISDDLRMNTKKIFSFSELLTLLTFI